MNLRTHLMVIKMLTSKTLQGGFTLIELIASMVLMAIMLPSVGLLVVNSMRAISTHNVSLQANVDAGFVQNNFTKHCCDQIIMDFRLNFLERIELGFNHVNDVGFIQLSYQNNFLIYPSGLFLKNFTISNRWRKRAK